MKKVQTATAERNADYTADDVKRQEASGATHIDVNAGARIGHEEEGMTWLLNVAQEATSLPLCLDSPDPAILEIAFGMVERTPMMAFLKGKKCRVIALCMDDSGMPKSVDDIFSRASSLVSELEGIGFERDDIFIDPLIQPMSVDAANGNIAFDAVEKIMTELKGVHTTGGLSNISYGLPHFASNSEIASPVCVIKNRPQ